LGWHIFVVTIVANELLFLHRLVLQKEELVMSQLRIPGFPAGSIFINERVSVLSKEGHVTYFLGSDNYFSHHEADNASQRFIIASLLFNNHIRVVEVVQSALNLSQRSVLRWLKQHIESGPGSFFAKPKSSRPRVMTKEKRNECTGLLAQGLSVAEVGRQAGIEESTLRKAIARGAVAIAPQDHSGESLSALNTATTDKSDRTREDALAVSGMGTACTRSDERAAAAFGLIHGTSGHYENSKDVFMGSLLVGLPTLCSNGLLSGLGKHLFMPEGFYSALHILMSLGFMALGRIRRPEGLRHIPPGELGKVIGLDRVPEAKTMRNKIKQLAENGDPEAWMKDLSRTWMEAEPKEAGYLYVDGHVRVYSGNLANLPRRYVSRQKLCLRGTTDYWVNDAVGQPFFVVSKSVTSGLAEALLKDIVPELLESVPSQPSAEALDKDDLLHRFVVIFDRECSNYKLLSQLWEQRIGAITYRKAVDDKWHEDDFKEVEVCMPGGHTTRMKLASKEKTISTKDNSMPVLEVRRLAKSGHQTAIITTARRLLKPVVAGRMFSRWCQENYFAYMMEHFDIDGLIEYGCDELPGNTVVINPAWRSLDKKVNAQRRELNKLTAKFGNTVIDGEEKTIQDNAELLLEIEAGKILLEDLRTKRKAVPKKITIDSLDEYERPQKLRPLRKILADAIKMIAYRAETALVLLIRKHLNKAEEARALIREILISSADIIPDKEQNTLTVRVHRMANPVNDQAAKALLEDLTKLNFKHPETGMRLIYRLV